MPMKKTKSAKNPSAFKTCKGCPTPAACKRAGKCLGGKRK